MTILGVDHVSIIQNREVSLIQRSRIEKFHTTITRVAFTHDYHYYFCLCTFWPYLLSYSTDQRKGKCLPQEARSLHACRLPCARVCEQNLPQATCSSTHVQRRQSTHMCAHKCSILLDCTHCCFLAKQWRAASLTVAFSVCLWGASAISHQSSEPPRSSIAQKSLDWTMLPSHQISYSYINVNLFV